MRKLIMLIALAGVVIYVLGQWNNHSELGDFLQQHLDNGEILTLEARYTPDQIIQNNRSKLVVDEQHKLQKPVLTYYPYLLMEVKYTTPEKKTNEGDLLWSLTDGEIVLNTDYWETTHGFSDCIESKACREDFKILQALALAPRGELSRDELMKKLHVESPEQFNEWLESAKQKKLIVQNGTSYILHFENPKIGVTPQSKINQPIVTKSFAPSQRQPRKYTTSQIEKISKAAFGEEFAIRNQREIYLPVYGIEILNPDGSVFTSYWNALTGQRLKR